MSAGEFMARSLALAEEGLGRCWPNPAVGCVIARDGVVVGEARTADRGRPHAEVLALKQAGERARGASAFVTLEPCSHVGATGPCAEALIEAGIAEVDVAIEDPDPRVGGRGVARLREAGVVVRTGLAADRARALQAGYLTLRKTGRPRVLLKLACSLDGKIATRSGESRWITSKAARLDGHRLRAFEDAIAIGSATALADDPLLTSRAPGLEGRSPVRVVFDTELRLPANGALARSAREVPLWILTAAPRPLGAAEIIETPRAPEGGLDVVAALAALGARGITRLLVEGGGRLAASLLGADSIDEIRVYLAPIALGAEARPAIAELGIERLGAAPRFRLDGVERLGEDALIRFSRREPLWS